MKFKYLIMAFSIIFVLILLTLALLPVFTAGPESAANLRNITLPLLLFITVILVCLGIYFLYNYRLLSLLEREDWPALAYYLEQKIYVKHKYNSHYVRLLASSYMVISDYASILKLENKALLAKPAVVEKNALVFGSARILGGKHEDAAVFLRTYMGKGRLKQREREWIRWFYGFSNLLGGAFSKAEPEFLSLAVSSGSALITGLSAYFLEKNLAKNSVKPEDCYSASKNGRSRVLETLKTAENWGKEVEKMAAEIHVTIIRKYVDEAGKWIFDNVSQESKK